MGIIGSFLDSYFSLDVVTDSPGDEPLATTAKTIYLNFTLSGGSREMAFKW
jgi:hypothetical protein